MLIVSNKTEEDRAADRAALLLPGGIITFFLGFFMLKDMGMIMLPMDLLKDSALQRELLHHQLPMIHKTSLL